jgi:murein DD-endopeptidase MepM/ murein hydrolase activator NlpD
MASAHEYKRFETSIIQKLTNGVITAGRGIWGALKAVGCFLTRRYTVVFVPHSEKNVFNFQVTVLSMFVFFLVFSGIVGVFLWYGSSYNETRSLLASKDSHLQQIQGSLDEMRDETAVLLREARELEKVFSGAVSVLGSGFNTQKTSSGDLRNFFDIRETPEDVLQDVNNLRVLAEYIAKIKTPIEEIGVMLDGQSAILAEIPSIWPIKGGLGHISMYFGQNINPFSGQYYIHKGIDISTYRSGDPVVSTANGQVVTIDYDENFGNYILIKHTHGYYTRYAHLLSARVRLGQRVQQGDVIGYIGNTGLSTGPHLHYEIHIGSDVVDPYSYINFRSTIAKKER